MWGGGYSFSMWQTLQMWQMLSKCILPHFAAHFAVFCGRLSPAKAVPLHRISKRAETTKTTKTTQTTNTNTRKFLILNSSMSQPIFRQRNQSIKAEFNLLLRSQMPTMLIYAKIAAEYGISEDRVRKIIRSP